MGEVFWEDFLGGFFGRIFFGGFYGKIFERIFLRGIRWEEFFVYDDLSRFWFLSRFCLNKEGRRRKDKKFRSLEVRRKLNHKNMVFRIIT